LFTKRLFIFDFRLMESPGQKKNSVIDKFCVYYDFLWHRQVLQSRLSFVILVIFEVGNGGTESSVLLTLLPTVLNLINVTKIVVIPLVFFKFRSN
jgi:hypothetical protein